MGFWKYNINSETDDAKTTLAHRDIIKRKRFLNNLYREWYIESLRRINPSEEGKIIEIGSGGGFIKEVYPNVITSDVQKFEHCDECFCAEKMPFEDGEIKGIFMINVLHHIQNCSKFFEEVDRVLHTNGKLIMIEPANTFFSRLIYKHIHHEIFDSQANWMIETGGRLSRSNIALPWIIFFRDKEQFNQRYKNLELKNVQIHTPFRYLLSGGVLMKAFVPASSFGFFSIIEKMLNPVMKYIGMFMTLEIVKKN